MSPRQAPTHWLTKEKLLALREEAGLTQRQMAKALGYTQSHYAMMECGARRIPTELSLCVRSKVIRYLNQQKQQIETVIKSISTSDT